MDKEKNSPDVKMLIKSIKNQSWGDAGLVEKAFNFAKTVHEGQARFTGDPYFYHVYATGKKLADFGMDTTTVIAGLLHDTIEDTSTTAKELEKNFGEEVLFLVEGVTKLGKLRYRGLERHVESLRKLFIATAEDVRVVIIKLADRLHNIQTLSGHPQKEKQKRIAIETLEIYAPLADRLGMGNLKDQLQDLSFPYVYPKEYEQVQEMTKTRNAVHVKRLEKFRHSLLKELARHSIKNIKTSYRVKHTYSLWKKLKRNNMDINKVYDITAIRIILPTVEDCYKVLGIIHGMWHPMPGRIKDYISLPKSNGYKSIHTTVFTGDGSFVEIQIRTKQMHKEAEFGIASHFAYKKGFFEKKVNPKDVGKKLGWTKQLLDLQANISEEEDKKFISNLKMNFFDDRVFVFTPNGDAIDLPAGAGPLDLAYIVHSELGSHTSGVQVNGKMSNLKYKLQNNDIVEITTNKNSHPTQKWLEYCITPTAQRKIKGYLQKHNT